MEQTAAFLEAYAARFNSPEFISEDPIQIPHRFTLLQDREIAGFWVAMLAWGNRKSILKSGNTLIQLMGNSPYDFILHHKEKHRAGFESFVHRTFNGTDALYFLDFLQRWYRKHPSLEDAFVVGIDTNSPHVGEGLVQFHKLFFDHPYAPQRTRKHIATPERKSTCKRLNMFLRWMVRSDRKGVDFGVWKKISPAQLLIPLDTHVDKVARQLGLLDHKQTDWQSVIALTEVLRQFDPEDPVKYDFALFGYGVLLGKQGLEGIR